MHLGSKKSLLKCSLFDLLLGTMIQLCGNCIKVKRKARMVCDLVAMNIYEYLILNPMHMFFLRWQERILNIWIYPKVIPYTWNMPKNTLPRHYSVHVLTRVTLPRRSVVDTPVSWQSCQSWNSQLSTHFFHSQYHYSNQKAVKTKLMCCMKLRTLWLRQSWLSWHKGPNSQVE